MLGCLILAGGASRRMGDDKATLDWRGLRAVDRVAAAAREAGVQAIVTCGRMDFGLPRASEDPPGGGPVAGLAAGCVRLRELGCDRALVLAVDAPTIRPEDLAPLLAAERPGAAFAHLHLPLVIWLDALPPGAGAGWSMARLVTDAGLALLEPSAEARERLRGANTPDERARLLAGLPGEADA